METLKGLTLPRCLVIRVWDLPFLLYDHVIEKTHCTLFGFLGRINPLNADAKIIHGGGLSLQCMVWDQILAIWWIYLSNSNFLKVLLGACHKILRISSLLIWYLFKMHLKTSRIFSNKDSRISSDSVKFLFVIKSNDVTGIYCVVGACVHVTVGSSLLMCSFRCRLLLELL